MQDVEPSLGLESGHLDLDAHAGIGQPDDHHRRRRSRLGEVLTQGGPARLEIDGIGFSEALTRARFEEINGDSFKNTLDPVKQVVEDSGLKETEVDEIALVASTLAEGGSVYETVETWPTC